jgi:hypothetical protein
VGHRLRALVAAIPNHETPLRFHRRINMPKESPIQPLDRKRLPVASRRLGAAALVAVAWAAPGLARATDPLDEVPPQPKLSEAAAARLPEGGLWLAGRSSPVASGAPDAFSIVKVGRTGAAEVFREGNTAVSAYHWLDRDTLIVFDDQGSGKGRVRFFVAGKPDAGRSVVVASTFWFEAAPR